MRMVFHFAVVMSLIVSGCIRPNGPSSGSEQPPTVGDRVSVSAESNGEPLPCYQKDGEFWLQATLEDSYQLILENPGTERIEVVVSVDGLNVISGQPADYRTQRGYVLTPRERLVIAGFRTGLESVAAFRFTSVENSYAAGTGTADNAGLIGLAIFDENPSGFSTARIAADSPVSEAVADSHGRILSTAPPRPTESTAETSGNDESSLAVPAKTTTAVGTGFGPSISAPAEFVPFVRRNRETPVEIIVLHYADEETLRAKGIMPDSATPPAPDPFPGTEKKAASALAQE